MIPVGKIVATGADLILPVDAAAARFVELGKSGYGKTNGDAVLIEGFVRSGIPTVVADPLGQMYGLRAGRDGEEKGGVKIAIFGGMHGDLPLPLYRAEYVADLLSEGVSAVLDLSLIDAIDHEEFMRVFLPRLLQRTQQHGVSMHVNFQEADRFAPERGSKPTPVTRWVRAARNAGMGWSFSTHKPQVLDKAVIETANVFVAYKMTGELAQAAIGGEIGSRIGKKTAAAMVDAVASFKRGEAWIVPDADWLDDGTEWEPVRVQFKLRDTFEVKPPKPGQQRREPKLLSDFGDLARLRAELDEEGSTAGDAEVPPATDTASAATIADLRAQLEGALARVGTLEHDLLAQRTRADLFAGTLQSVTDAANAALAEQGKFEMVTVGDIVTELSELATASRADPAPTATPGKAIDPGKGGPAKLLAALAGYRDGRASRVQLGMLAGYAASGGTFNRYLSALRSAGYVEGDGSTVRITPEGRKVVGNKARAVTPAQVIEVWRGKIDGGPRKLLDALLRVHPRGLTRKDLGDQAGYEASGGTFNRYLSTLRSLELVEVRGSSVVAASTLFPQG